MMQCFIVKTLAAIKDLRGLYKFAEYTSLPDWSLTKRLIQ